MWTVKLVAGLVCLILALNFLLVALDTAAWFSEANLAALISAAIFGFTGWFLILKRRSPMPAGGRIFIVTLLFLLGLWIVAIAIPDFVFARYHSSQNSCINNLRQLQSAKEEWALENGKTNGALPTVADLTPYIQLDSKGNLPHCPAGGSYIIGRVGEDVKCSIGISDWPNNHNLSDTNDFTWWINFKESYATLFGFHHVWTR